MWEAGAEFEYRPIAGAQELLRAVEAQGSRDPGCRDQAGAWSVRSDGMGPVEEAVRILLGDMMGKTAIGLEIQFEGGPTPAVQEMIGELDQTQRMTVFVEATKRWVDIAVFLAREIERVDPDLATPKIL